MDVIQQFAIIKALADSISSTSVAIVAALAALIALVGYFLSPFRYLAGALRALASRRREASEAEAKRRITSCKKLHCQLKALAAYYDSAALRLEEILDLVGPDNTDVQLPVLKLREIIDKPIFWIDIDEMTDIGTIDKLVSSLKIVQQRYRIYGGLLKEFQKKERAFVVPVDMLRIFRKYLLESRKHVAQTGVLLEIYVTLNVPKQRRTSLARRLRQCLSVHPRTC